MISCSGPDFGLFWRSIFCAYAPLSTEIEVELFSCGTKTAGCFYRGEGSITRLPPKNLPCYYTGMTVSTDMGRVLVVDEDPDVLDLLERQVLKPLGYEVAIASDAATAIQQAINFMPDLIIASMTLPGLSGKDLLVALRSQGIELPTLVMAQEGMEADAIAAFRLGANDYLKKPLREAEVVTAVERAINETRLRGERQRLAQQLAESNRQLEHRVRELTTLFGIPAVMYMPSPAS